MGQNRIVLDLDKVKWDSYCYIIMQISHFLAEEWFIQSCYCTGFSHMQIFLLYEFFLTCGFSHMWTFLICWFFSCANLSHMRTFLICGYFSHVDFSHMRAFLICWFFLYADLSHMLNLVFHTAYMAKLQGCYSVLPHLLCYLRTME
jgi:hypothetical protein